MDLLRAGEIDEKTVLRRMEPQKLDELLHPVFDKDDLKRAQTVAKGLQHLRVPLPVRLYSSLMMQRHGRK